MEENKDQKPVALLILDGWGMRNKTEGNAVALANIPHYDEWEASYERSILDASGEEVGLPAGQMGNSEVGHLNLGAGRIVYQDITRIDLAIRQEKLSEIQILRDAFSLAGGGISKLHIIGLLGTGGVHSHQRHLHALLDMVKGYHIDPILHVITDGRDTPPTSSIGFLEALESKLSEMGSGTIASVSGRYYAMDRDKRWERTSTAYRAMVDHESDQPAAASAMEAIQKAHAADQTDEFIEPTIIQTDRNVNIERGDVVLFFNFRADRMRQIVQCFTDPDFDGFEREFVKDLSVLSMTRYAETLDTSVLFPDQNITNTLSETISRAGLTQVHAAETEKYPHVTFFFNGGEETPFEGESRILVPSPKVATYDLQPEMSARELTDQVVAHLQTEKPNFVLINYANPDMVGHTGSLEAAIQAVETVDGCAADVVAEILAQDGVVLITADHGNCERMIELSTGQPHTYHTTNPVALIAVSNQYINLMPRGKLADVAPTILNLLGVDVPEGMTGLSLLA